MESDNQKATLTYQKECSVHHSGAVQHGGHQNVVTRAIDKRHVSKKGTREKTLKNAHNFPQFFL